MSPLTPASLLNFTTNPWTLYDSTTALRLSQDFYGLQSALELGTNAVPFGGQLGLDPQFGNSSQQSNHSRYVNSPQYGNYLYAFSDGCANGNCNASCNGSFGAIFDSLSTLHNCAIFGNVTDLDGHKSNGDQGLAQELHFLDDGSASTAQNAAQVIGSCLINYCKTLPGCNPNTGSRVLYDYLDNSTAGSDNSNKVVSGYGGTLVGDICNHVPSHINPDVGGIGIYISYWIQTGLAMLGFSFTVFWMWIAPGIPSAYFCLRYGWNAMKERVNGINENAQKHLSRLLSALTDFHKAQCFFTLATTIAALVAIHRGGFEPESLQQIYNTWIFLRVIAVNGFLTISFTLTNLYLVNMLSWYLILLSTLSVATSMAALFSVGTFVLSDQEMEYLANLSKSGGPPECNFTSPGVYCHRAPWLNYYVDSKARRGWVSSTNFSLVNQNTEPVLAFCLTIMFLLIVYKSRTQILRMARYLYALLLRGASPSRLQGNDQPLVQSSEVSGSHHPASAENTNGFRRTGQWLEARRNGIAESRMWEQSRESWLSLFTKIQDRLRLPRHVSSTHLLLWLLKFAIHAIFFAFYVVYFVNFLSALRWFYTAGASGSNWNFGQIVAITLWIPPIVEYIHLEMRGMQRGFDHRLLPPFRVVMTTNKDTDRRKASTATTSSIGSDNDDNEDEDVEAAAAAQMIPHGNGPAPSSQTSSGDSSTRTDHELQDIPRGRSAQSPPPPLLRRRTSNRFDEV